MRKIFGVLLSVLCICCAAIGLTGCKKDKHIHAFDKQVITDEYKATDATCTEKATYYSCECGEKGAETFEYGSTTEHNFVNGSCTYCGKKQETSLGLAFTLLDDGTYEVSGIGSCTDTEIVILSVYNDKPVTSIGNYAFSDCTGLTSVTIPDSVTSIGYSAFDVCSRLKTVFYKGSAEQWSKISIDSRYNDDLTSATRYYYSETEPTLNAEGTAYDGNFWHYDADGITPVIWKKEN